MKKLYFLLLTLLITSVSFGQIYQEDFETDTNGTNYATSIAEFSDGSRDFFIRTDGSDITGQYVLSGINNSFYFAGQDIDAEGATLPVSLSTSTIDISSLTDIDFVILLAEDDDGSNQDWDAADYMHITYSIDGGTAVDILWVESDGATNTTPRIDTDFDGTGEGAEITSTFSEFVISDIATGGGSSIVFTMEFNLNSGDEDLAIDNIRVFDTYAASPTISITAPADVSVFAPGTTSVNVEFTTANLVGGETVDIDVNGTVTNNVTSPFAVTTVDGMSYSVTVSLIDGGVLDTDSVSFSVGSLVTVADVTALRADVIANGLGRFYEITGGSLVTHTDGFNNRKWIQDSNISGVLIYDQAGTIATTYAVGVMVTGLRGTTEESNGVLRFVPTSDAGTIASSGNAVTPQVVTIPDFNAAPNDYESELIQINNVTFVDGDGIVTFTTGDNFDVTDGTNIVVKRTEFFSADYIDELIPQGMLSGIIGVAGEFNGVSQIYVRSLADLTLSADQFDVSNFSLYPNPTTTGKVTITTTNSATISVRAFDILGKLVINTTLTNNTLDVSNLKSGLYILKISQEGNSVIKKLVIR